MNRDRFDPVSPEKIHAYIKAKVLPALAAPAHSYSLELASPGTRNIIWFLTVDGRGRYVLKAVAKRFRIKNIIWAHARLERCGIPVPRLFFADRAWQTAKSLGYYVACEERIDGTPLDEMGEARRQHIARVAALFAGMHAIRSIMWGKIKSFRIFGFGDYFMRKTAERLEALGQSGCTIGGRPAADMRAWFERKKSAIRPCMSFSLCHGDVNMKNILLRPDGTICLIDTESFKFFPFQIEYFRLAHTLCGFDQTLQKQFEEAYLNAARRKHRRELERCGELFRAYVLLEIAWHFNKKLKLAELPASDRTACTETRGRALDELAAIAANTS